jgi:hypothetical protein
LALRRPALWVSAIWRPEFQRLASRRLPSQRLAFQRLAFQRLVFLEPAFPQPVLPGLAYLISALPGPAFRGQSLGRPGARWRRAWPQVSISASGAYSW